MSRKKSFEITDELLNKIISAAYGDAGLWDKLYVNRLAAKYDNVNDLFKNYKQTASEVHNIKEEEFPEELLVRVERKTIGINKRAGTFAVDFFSVIFSRPVASAAVSIILICFILFGVFNNNPKQYQYSQSEIELADRQAKQAFAIVGKIFDQTNTTLKEEVLKSRVAKPIRESIGFVNEVLSK